MEKNCKSLKIKIERFKCSAEYRTNEILKKLKTLGNCANRSIYDYNEDQIEMIFNEIEKRTLEIKAKFNFSKGKDKKFKL
ncbi:hypothetical protein K8R66_02265 [bacterium]|nr:hypothetical protein [bacterium]